MNDRSKLSGSIKAFLRWWLGELRGCVPPPLLRVISPAADRLEFEIAADRLVLRESTGAGVRDIGSYARDGVSPEVTAEQIRAALSLLENKRRLVVLRLPASWALRKIVDLPEAAEENLTEVLAFDMERQTPFPADQVYFDGRLAGRNSERKRIAVDLMVLPKAVVDPTVDLLRRSGAPPDALDVAVAGQGVPRRLLLVPDENGATYGLRRVRLAKIALGGMAALLLIAAVAVPMERQRRFAETLATEVALARKEADGSRTMLDDISALTKLDQFLTDKKRSRAPAVAVLNEITEVLPDDTWLFRLRIASDEIQTFGYSAAASNLIGPLEQSPMFKAAQFRAPLMREPRVDAERFHIGLQQEEQPRR